MRIGMTPFGLALRHRLNNEILRMQNEWFFKWHFIGKDGPVDIDSFDGRKIHYGGISFFGTAREVYWDTLKRYISNNLNETFLEAEKVLENYPLEMSVGIIEDVKNILSSFNRQIADIAVDKDKVLRGNGVKFPEPDRARGNSLLQLSSLEQRTAALKELVELKLSSSVQPTAKAEKKGENSNLSYREFKDELLIAIAIYCEGKPANEVEALASAKFRKLTFREGWLRQATRSLHDEGYVSAAFYMGQGEDGGMTVRILGPGLEEAEELCNELGFDLYEEIDEVHNRTTTQEIESLKDIPASDRAVKIDHNSSAYREVVDGITKVSETAKLSNSLTVEGIDQRDQYLAELDAGKALLKTSQVNPTLVERLIVPALKWIAGQIGDIVAGIVITTLLAAVAKLLGFV